MSVTFGTKMPSQGKEKTSVNLQHHHGTWQSSQQHLEFRTLLWEKVIEDATDTMTVLLHTPKRNMIS